ncbi:hypothetical protein [Desulfosarcina ovata]|nr:hypothetical protein [Desulfosarcina ovata]
MKTTFLPIGLLLMLLFWGCAAPMITSSRPPHDVVVDGTDDEWPRTAQYVDEKHQLVVRVSNDDQSLFVCLAICDDEFQRSLGMSGLSLWLDPVGGETRTFGIHLPGRKRRGHFQGGMPPQGPPPEKIGPEGPDRPPAAPSMELPKTLKITYKDTTGPLEMTLDEVRRSGIDIGVGRTADGRQVYEFKIAFAAAPSLSRLGPQQFLGVGIQSGSATNDRHDAGAPEGAMKPGGGRGGPMGGPPPGGMGGMGGGSMGGAPKGSGPGSKGASKACWLKVLLSDTDETDATIRS